MPMCDWSSDVCSSDLTREPGRTPPRHAHGDLTSLAPHETLSASDRTDPADTLTSDFWLQSWEATSFCHLSCPVFSTLSRQPKQAHAVLLLSYLPFALITVHFQLHRFRSSIPLSCTLHRNDKLIFISESESESRSVLSDSLLRFFSKESFLQIRWPKYWSFSFSIWLPMNIQV